MNIASFKESEKFRKAGNILAWSIVAISLLRCVSCFIEVARVQENDTPWHMSDNSLMATKKIEDYIKPKLGFPWLTKFEDQSTMKGKVEKLPDHQYKITSWVDVVQEQFAVETRTHFVIVVCQASEENWQLVSLKMK